MSTRLSHDTVRALLPSRPDDSHKGTFGHVCILAGSAPYSGAAKLAALGAGRSGAGLVTVGVPMASGVPVSASLLGPIVTTLPSREGRHFDETSLAMAAGLLVGKDSLVIGPGIGQFEGTAAFVSHVLNNPHPPAVVDADGLNLVANLEQMALLNETVATPHPGELARLMQTSTATIQANREGNAASFAKETGAVVVLKGHDTVIAAPEGATWIAPVGNSGMATGGSGDILAGLIGGLLAQGMPSADAAVLGVYVHGLAGDHAARLWGKRAMMAGEIVDALGDAWRDLEGAPL